MRCFVVVIISSLGLLAGCAASPPSVSAVSSSGYDAQVMAVRTVTGGAITQQITQLLGQTASVSLTSATELVVRLSDGEVKSFVPPPGTVPVGLVSGDYINVTETPQMRISLR